MKDKSIFNKIGIILLLVAFIFFLLSTVILLVSFPARIDQTVNSKLSNTSSSNNDNKTITNSVSKLFSTPIKIIGDNNCQSDTLNALQLISEKAPTHYAIVIKYIGSIECVSEGSGMFAYENPPRYAVGDKTRNAGITWYAGTIVHDAGHSKLYNDYKDSNESVPSDVWTGKNAESICIQAQLDAVIEMNGPQDQIDYIKKSLDTDYYNIPYSERWW